jgi:hypothetical protein
VNAVNAKVCIFNPRPISDFGIPKRINRLGSADSRNPFRLAGIFLGVLTVGVLGLNGSALLMYF